MLVVLVATVARGRRCGLVLVLVATVVRVKRAPVRPGLVLVLWRRPLPAALFAGAGAASLVVAGTLLVVGDTTIRGEASVDVLVCTSLGTLYAALTRVAARTRSPISAIFFTIFSIQ